MTLFVVAFLVSYLLTPRALNMLAVGGLLRSNFAGKQIPAAGGIVFSAALAVTYFLFSVLGESSVEAYVYLGFCSFISLAGLVDDVAGNRSTGGFKGHFFFLLRKGEFTTGIWKLVLGGVVAALSAAMHSALWWDMALNTVLVALSANLFNLFDVRPGRSIKAFIFSALLILLFLPSYPTHILLSPLAGAVAAYAVYDIRGRAMMGDSGSNLIGLAVGICVIAGGSLALRIGVLMIFFVLHVISEYRSFTEIIGNNRILGFLDHWGRRE